MKKQNTFKRILAAALSLMLILALTACGGTKAPESAAPESTAPVTSSSAPESTAPEAARELNIAIVKQMDHPSLDEIANAITAQLDTIAQDNETATKTLQDAGVEFDFEPDIQSFKDMLGGAEYYQRYANETWFNQELLDQILAH